MFSCILYLYTALFKIGNAGNNINGVHSAASLVLIEGHTESEEAPLTLVQIALKNQGALIRQATLTIEAQLRFI